MKRTPRALVFQSFFIFILSFVFTGCATITVPKYIKDSHPYKEVFYYRFNEVQEKARVALSEIGWSIESTADPTVFERNKLLNETEGEQILIFSKVRQGWFILGKKYSRVNVYLRAGKNNTAEVELRYIRMTSVPFKIFEKFENDRFAKKLFSLIDKKLAAQ
ncbi:MAG: hypothetical protein H6755_04840 [Candidatus Omnitrophica bacterium]|nr:hypothetical protein [Candidatus Omnitrophota bacterium]MCB9747718.1 hypothetical protein [Candidatus Omnitrophota bacterium]